MFYFTSTKHLLNFYLSSMFVLEQGVDNGKGTGMMFFDKRSGKAERPAWEQNIPTLGTKHSLLGNKVFPRWEYLISYEYFSIREPYSKITCQYQNKEA